MKSTMKNKRQGLNRYVFTECKLVVQIEISVLNEPRSEKTGFLHMRKQRRRSASR